MPPPYSSPPPIWNPGGGSPPPAGPIGLVPQHVPGESCPQLQQLVFQNPNPDVATGFRNFLVELPFAVETLYYARGLATVRISFEPIGTGTGPQDDNGVNPSFILGQQGNYIQFCCPFKKFYVHRAEEGEVGHGFTLLGIRGFGEAR